MQSLQRLSEQMDRAVSALKEQRDLEAEVYLLIKTSSSLLEKLTQRDQEIMRLRSELMLMSQQLSAFVTVEQATQDE